MVVLVTDYVTVTATLLSMLSTRSLCVAHATVSMDDLHPKGLHELQPFVDLL